MDGELWFYLAFSIICTVGGIYNLKTSLKKYSICVKGKCTNLLKYDIKTHHFKYIIDGVEYNGIGRSSWIMKRGKVYSIRVDKDNLEHFVTTGFIISPLVWGIILLTGTLIGLVIELH